MNIICILSFLFFFFNVSSPTFLEHIKLYTTLFVIYPLKRIRFLKNWKMFKIPKIKIEIVLNAYLQSLKKLLKTLCKNVETRNIMNEHYLGR